jgi:LysR family transcriptional regulator, regulator for bpeEF and oprC
MDYFNAVRVFTRVVETGSFVKAANSLRLPRNTVTKLVQSLETRLRMKLLNRTTRRVSPTTDGAAYYDRMSRLLAEWCEVESEVATAQAQPRGRLRVDMGAALATRVVIPALPEFQAQFPDLQLEIGASDRPADLVSEGVDCVIRAGIIAHPSLIARHIADLPLLLCATRDYLQRHGHPQHPADLADKHTLVRYFYAGSNGQKPIDLRLGDEQFRVEGRHYLAVNDGNALLAAGLAGLGVIHTLAADAQPYIDSGKLVRLLPEWSSDPVPISIVYAPNRHLSSRVRVFAEWLARLFASHSAAPH